MIDLEVSYIVDVGNRALFDELGTDCGQRLGFRAALLVKVM